MELAVIAAVFVPLSALIMNAFSDESDDDFDFVLKAVIKNGVSIEYANEKFKNDRNLALEAVKSSPYSFDQFSEIFKNDRDIALEAVKNGSNLKLVSDEFKDDPEILLNALKDGGEILLYASDNLKNNRDRLVITSIPYQVNKSTLNERIAELVREKKN